MKCTKCQNEILDSDKLGCGYCDPNIRGCYLASLGKNEEAVDVFRGILKVDKSDVLVSFNMANALCTLGRFDEALEVCEDALKIHPDNLPVFLSMGKALNNLGRTKEAVDVWSRYLKIEREQGVPLNLWFTYSCAQNILGIEPDNILALISQGLVYSDLGKHSEAFELFDKASEIDPSNIEVCMYKGTALVLLGNCQEAIIILEKVLIVEPNNEFALANMGEALLRLDKMEEAVDVFSRAIKINSERTATLVNMGVAFSHLGKHSAAIEMYNRALKIDPNNEIALTNLKSCEQEMNEVNTQAIVCLIKKKKYEEAIERLDKVLEINPNDYSARRDRTFALEELNKYQKATHAPQAVLSGAYLFFDTETTGLPRNWNAPVSDLDNWPRLVQIAWVFYKNGAKISSSDFIIKPEGFRIPMDASNIHGITTERAEREGVPLQVVLNEFQNMVEQADCLIAHNISFDEKIMGAEFLRKDMPNSLISKKTFCTKERSTNFCAIPSPNGYGDYKWPKLSELYLKLFGTEFEDSHSALADVNATAECFWELEKRGIIN